MCGRVLFWKAGRPCTGSGVKKHHCIIPKRQINHSKHFNKIITVATKPLPGKRQREREREKSKRKTSRLRSSCYLYNQPIPSCPDLSRNITILCKPGSKSLLQTDLNPKGGDVQESWRYTARKQCHHIQRSLFCARLKRFENLVVFDYYYTVHML
jgi:hypothetical protein